MRHPSPIPSPPAQHSSARKISPHVFWLQKNSGIELVEELLEFQIVLLKEHTDDLTQAHTL